MNQPNASENFPTIYCSVWWDGPYEGSEVVKYWWHPDALSQEQFEADVKKCVTDAITEWMDSDEDYFKFDYIHNYISEDSEYWSDWWKHWLDADVLERRMAELGYRKCKNLVFVRVPLGEPTRDLDQSEEWKQYLGTELHARVEERNARREARDLAEFRKKHPLPKGLEDDDNEEE